MSASNRRSPESPGAIALLALAGVLLVAQIGVGVAYEECNSITTRRALEPYVRFWPFNIRCGNETSAISTLRNISSAQAQFSAAGVVDQDGDGVGEHGTFAEMSGIAALRGKQKRLIPPVLSGSFRTVLSDGTVPRSGYRFRMFLVGSDGRAVTERASNGRRTVGGIAADEVDAEGCETRWVCYAWPEAHDRSGLRTFVVDHTGDIFGVDDPRYSGATGPTPGAVYPGGGRDVIGDVVVPGAPAQDGNVWRQVN